MTTASPPESARTWLTIEGCSSAIAAVLEEELRAWSGTWRVSVDGGLVGGWCAYRVTRDDGVGRTLLFAPGEHDPGLVRQSLSRVLESLPPRPAATVLVPVAEERRAVLRR